MNITLASGHQLKVSSWIESNNGVCKTLSTSSTPKVLWTATTSQLFNPSQNNSLTIRFSWMKKNRWRSTYNYHWMGCPNNHSTPLCENYCLYSTSATPFWKCKYFSWVIINSISKKITVWNFFSFENLSRCAIFKCWTIHYWV